MTVLPQGANRFPYFSSSIIVQAFTSDYKAARNDMLRTCSGLKTIICVNDPNEMYFYNELCLIEWERKTPVLFQKETPPKVLKFSNKDVFNATMLKR